MSFDIHPQYFTNKHTKCTRVIGSRLNNYRIIQVPFREPIVFPPQRQGLLDNRVVAQSNAKILVNIVKNTMI